MLRFFPTLLWLGLLVWGGLWLTGYDFFSQKLGLLYAVGWLLGAYFILGVACDTPLAVLSSVSGALIAGWLATSRLPFLGLLAGYLFALGLGAGIQWTLCREKALRLNLLLGSGVALLVCFILPWATWHIALHCVNYCKVTLDYNQLVFMLIAATSGLVIGILQRNLWVVIILGAGLPLILFGGFSQEHSTHWQGAVLTAAAQATVIGLWFALPYRIAATFAQTRGAIIAGSLGAAMGYSAFWQVSTADLWWLFLGLGLLALGLSYSLWRPIISFPLMEAYNHLLLRLDRYQLRTHPALPIDSLWYFYHSAHWDKQQWFSLPSLGCYGRLLQQYYPDAVDRWLMPLNNTRYIWIITDLQRNQTISLLEQATTLAAIAHIHTQPLAYGNYSTDAAMVDQFRIISQDIAIAMQQNTRHAQRLMLGEVEERLGRLVVSLGDAPGAVHRPFQEIALSWRDCVHHTQRIWRENSDQEIDNPYVVGVPLTAKQEIFVGRQKISIHLERLFLSPQCPPVLLYGQRRIGKTSLLHNLNRLISSRMIFVYIDFQSPRMLTGKITSILFGVSLAIARAVGEVLPAGCNPPVRQKLEENLLSEFAEWLQGLEEQLHDQTILLALDEFAVLEDMRQQGTISEMDIYTLLSLFRHLMQNRPHFRLLLVGSHTIPELGQWAGHLNNVQVVHLGCLSREETRQLVEVPVPGFDLFYTPKASERVWELTSGHAALTQLLCSEIVTLKNAQTVLRRSLVEYQDVEVALSNALTAGSFFFQDILKNQVSTTHLVVLLAIAEQGPTAVTEEYLQERFGTSLRPAIRALELRELIIRQPEGGYGFSVEIVRQGILRLT